MHFISVRSDRSVRFAYREKPDCPKVVWLQGTLRVRQ